MSTDDYTAEPTPEDPLHPLKPDLSLVSTDAMVNELKKRFCSFVLLGYRANGVGVADFFLQVMTGSQIIALGMLEVAKDNAVHSHTLTPPPPPTHDQST